MPGAPLRLGSGALLGRASDLANVTREALGHHVEACFSTRFSGEGVGRKAPDIQEFIGKAIEEIQEARFLQGVRHPPRGTAHCPGQGKEFRVCINIPGSTRPRLGSSSGRLVSADAGVHLIATSACPLASRAQLWRSSIAQGTSWRLTRLGTRRPWQRWRCIFGSLLGPLGLPRLGAKAAREGRLQQRASLTTPTSLQ